MSNTPNKRRSFANKGIRLLGKIKGEVFSKSSKQPNGQVMNDVGSSSFHPKRELSSSRLDAAEELHEAKITTMNLDRARKPGIIPKMWTEEQDTALKIAVNKYGERNWKEIAAEVPGRTALQCHQRWKKALRPGLKKGTWSPEEDTKLISLVKESKDWIYIAGQIEGRNPKQCRERWRLNLDPSIKRTPWTEDEDKLLKSLYAKQGGRWSQIAKSIPGRTENNVKTRFHSLQRLEAKLRGWTPQEDQVLTSECMRIGRDFQTIAKLLPGRTKGMLKKRFAILVQQDPDILVQVEKLELAVRQQQNTKSHRTKDGRSLKRELSSTQKEKNQQLPHEAKYTAATSYYQTRSIGMTEPQHMTNDPMENETIPPRVKQLTSRSNSSWLEEVVENITEPILPHSMSRTDSTSVLLDVIENTTPAADYSQNEDVQMENFGFQTTDSQYGDGQGRQKQLGEKTNSLSLLEKFIGGDLDTWDMDIPVDSTDANNPAIKTKQLAPKGSYLSSGMEIDFARISQDSRVSQNGGHGKMLLGEMEWGANNNITPDKQRGFTDMRSLSEVLNM